MKVLYLINNLQGGGAEKLLTDLLLYMKRYCHVDVLLLNNQNPKYFDKLLSRGININVLSSKNSNPLKVLEIRGFIKRGKYDIVHAHLFPSLYYAAIAAIGIGTSLVYTEHSTSNKRRKYLVFKYIERVIYSRYKKIICISESTKKNLLEHLSLPRFTNCLITINNGIVLPDVRISNRKIDIYKPIINVIMIGRFEVQKDQNTVIRAMKLLDSRFHLFLAGTGSLMSESKKLSKAFGLSDRVNYLGFVEDINSLLQDMDIAILSSNWEGFGLAALETMVMGVPTIGSDVAGLSEVISDGGFLFDRGNEIELAKMIIRIAEDNELYSTLSERGIKRANQFDISSTCNEYLKVYEESS